MSQKRLSRFHRDIFFPDWYENSLEEFLESLTRGGAITFSLHALEKSLEYSHEYGIRLKKYLSHIVKKDSLKSDNIFEFYSVEKIVKKACFRFSFEDFPVDLVVVISEDGIVITIYDTNKGDSHLTMDKKLYERSR